MSDWVTDYYDDVDNMRLEPYLEHHTDDAVVTFGNNPPAVGKEAIRAAIGGFFSTIGGLKHTFVHSYTDGDTTYLELSIDYTRKDGGIVTVPAASVLHRRGDLVDALRIYIDVAPIYAPAE
ncbi:MAG TPA: nuclear transport factor 2 family protein [Solirubrobacteraceae bacterium]|nr:nuclear transport factor 2 family protein [Solirubrobacteraceae bacterium]